MESERRPWQTTEVARFKKNRRHRYCRHPNMECKYVAIIVLVVIVYLCVGAAIFMHLEKPAEIALRKNIRQTIESFKGNYSCVDQERLNKFF